MIRNEQSDYSKLCDYILGPPKPLTCPECSGQLAFINGRYSCIKCERNDSQ